MMFVLTLMAFLIAIMLMALGLFLGRGKLHGRCGAECRCFDAEVENHAGKIQ